LGRKLENGFTAVQDLGAKDANGILQPTAWMA
jgi:hypothetical protein